MTTKRKSSTKKPATKKSSRAKSTTASLSGEHFEPKAYEMTMDGKPIAPPEPYNPAEFDPPPHPFWHGVAVISAVLVALSVIAWVFNEWVTQ